MINVSPAFNFNNSNLVTVIRTEAGEYVNGRYQDGESVEIKIYASVQPAQPDTMEVLQMGFRNTEGIQIVSKQSLRTTQDKTGEIADIVLHNDKRYRVVNVTNWKQVGYWSSVAMLEENQSAD